MSKTMLTDKQRSVLAYLVSKMDSDNVAETSFNEIQTATGGQASYYIDNLDKKGYLEVLYKGQANRKSRYRICPKGDGPQDYSSVRNEHRSRYAWIQDTIDLARDKVGDDAKLSLQAFQTATHDILIIESTQAS